MELLRHMWCCSSYHALSISLTATDGAVINLTYPTANPTIADYEEVDLYNGKIAIYNLTNPIMVPLTVGVMAIFS